jgi:hypothetical protein
MKKMKEMFEALVRLKTNCYTAESSDDSSAIKREEWNYEKALASQYYFTDNQITNEANARWDKMIAKMNKEYSERSAK